MSLILDALRKMEEERKARHGGPVDIRPAVLCQRGDDPPATRNLIMLVVAGAILLLAGIVAGVLLKGGPSPTLQHPVDQSAAGTEDKPALPPAPPQTIPIPAEPVRTPPTATVPAMPTTPPLRRPVADDQPPAAASEPADTSIAISGIAWQEERGLRRAVVNGALVGEGAEIAGARIVEIRERSVRFSRGGRTFEVSYASAFPSR